MNWNMLTTVEQLGVVDEISKSQPVVIFKHSTRCSISAAAKSRLERQWSDETPVKPYYLDLLSHRYISNAIAERYGVAHQSPQVLLIKEGKVVYTESHMGISVAELLEQA